MNLKISVVIPYYNADKFIDECLDSITNQSLQADEVIIIDDGSSPDSKKHLERFESFAKIIYLEHNAGVAHARNVGIKHATGDWVAFQDSDDIWEENKLEKQVEALVLNPGWIGCHTGVTVFDGENDVFTFCDKPNPLTLEDLLKSDQVIPSSLILKKSVLDEMDGYDIAFRCSEDYDLNLRLVKKGYIIGFIPEALIRFRRSSHGNISSHWDKTLKGHLMIVKKHRDVFLTLPRANITRKFIAKSIRSSGNKLGGFMGKILAITGSLLGISFSREK